MPSRLKSATLALLSVLVLALAVALMLLHEGLRTQLSTVLGLLMEGDPVPLQEWVAGFGLLGPLISGLLQILTSVIPPLPSFLLSIVNAMLYGPVLGGLLTFLTALIAAAVCFKIGRLIGRPGVERWISRRNLMRFDRFMAERGFWTVFAGRLIPFVNPDVVSYAAGVTNITWRQFLLGMGLGAIPATVFYSVVGAAAVELSGYVLLVVSLASILPLVLLFFFRRRIQSWWRRRRRARNRRVPPADHPGVT